MACFLVPMIWAIVLTGVQYMLHRKYPDHPALKKYRLWALNAMLWGGVVMLAIEHLAHGEVVPWPPFLTAMSNPEDIPIMLEEMKVIGGTMTTAIFAIWGIGTLVVNAIPAREERPHTQ